MHVPFCHSGGLVLDLYWYEAQSGTSEEQTSASLAFWEPTLRPSRSCEQVVLLPFSSSPCVTEFIESKTVRQRGEKQAKQNEPLSSIKGTGNEEDTVEKPIDFVRCSVGEGSGGMSGLWWVLFSGREIEEVSGIISFPFKFHIRYSSWIPAPGSIRSQSVCLSCWARLWICPSAL